MPGEHQYVPGRYDIDPVIQGLVDERKARGLSRQVVADAFFSTKSRIMGWEAGAFRPRIDLLRDWAYVLGFDLMLVPRKHVEQIKETLAELKSQEER